MQTEINCASTRSVVHSLFRVLAQPDVPVVERPMENANSLLDMKITNIIN